MINQPLCPKCDNEISNIHYQSHEPHPLSGFKGSKSYTAVAYPCGHALGAVPATWEMRLEDISKDAKETNRKIENLYKELAELAEIIKQN
jgi:hypothetical protein